VVRFAIVVACISLLGPHASAQPAPQPDKVDARSLMQSGVKLLEAKDYLGALAVFKDAYARFQSAKILLNIGTTQALLGRKADAANSYQRYLDAPDTDPAKRADVATQLTELDKANAIVELSVTPGDAEILLGETWQPAPRVWRVSPGDVSLKARRDGFTPGEAHASAKAGTRQRLAIVLVALPAIERVVTIAPVVADPPRSRFGAFARAHVSVVPKLGSAVLVGAIADATPRFSIEAAALLGPGIVESTGSATLPPPKLGLYGGASFTLGDGTLRPRVTAGIPIFFDDGPRAFARAAVGVEAVANPHLSFVFDLGGELALNAQMDVRTFAFVPSLGLTGRL
jgi:hypothetical protein